MLSNALQRVAAFPIWAKTLLALAALVVAALLVLLSPLVVILAFLVLIVAVFALVIRLLRHRSLRRWGIIAATSLVVLLVFTGISNALYFGGQPEQANSPEPQNQTANPDTKQKPSKQAEQQKGGEQSDAAGSDKGNATAEELHPPVTVKITRVVDGDTIEISPSVDGKDTVRLIGIDAPEEASSGCRAQPLAQDATDQASLWEGQRVKLEFDKDRTDQYGRLLAYVPDPMTRSMMNVEMIKEGYAQVYIVPPNTKHEAELRKAQAEAKDMAEAMGVNLGLYLGLTPSEGQAVDRPRERHRARRRSMSSQTTVSHPGSRISQPISQPIS